MARTYKWTIEIEISAINVEKYLTFGDDLAFNDHTAYDVVVQGMEDLLSEEPARSFKVRSVKLQKPDGGALAFALQFGEPKLSVVK